MPHYTILDGARLESHLEQGKVLNEQYRSLYRGETDPDIEAVGPFLFTFPGSDDFKAWLYEKGLHDHWGILLESTALFEEIYRHFRKFLMVRTEDGQKLYFRFYDPRVLRIFLPTCDAGQLREFFGPVARYFCADEDPAFFLVYSLRFGQLHIERLPIEEALKPASTPSVTPSVTPSARPIIIIRRK